MTHYVPAYAVRLGLRERAICGAYVLPTGHALEPSCHVCRSLIASEETPERPAAVDVAEVVERY